MFILASIMRAAFLGAMLLGAPAFAGEFAPCPGTKMPPLSLPHLKQALASNQDITIVALGSSSTAGVHASNVAHSYPALLQAELSKALPASHIVVLNRGIGGQDVPEELPRIDKDALAIEPELVIWQVGANGAMRHADTNLFAQLVTAGIQKMEAAGVDVVMMDNQRSPMVMAAPEHTRIEQTLSDVAKAEHAGLFSRSRLMDAWQDGGFPYADFVSHDGVHHNDRGYACVAKALAESIVAGLGSTGPLQIAAKSGGTVTR